MSQLKRVVEPFGEVNVYPTSGGATRVVATILMEPHKEGAQTGIALDGSGSMSKLYGMDGGSRVVSSIFGAPRPTTNEITPVAQKVCSYLAHKIDADGGTTCIYWATGPGGSEIEVVGDLTADQADRHTFGPPKDFGTGTQLLPAVKYFTERFRTAPWGFYVFVTDGELHDLDAVLAYSKRLAMDVASKRRNPVKFVLIGVGPDVNEYQMEELDDLDTGTDVDLWDHKIASEMRQLQDIFAEVVDRNARVASGGRILDASGRVVRDYERQGLPAYLEFEVPAGTESFTLELEGRRIHQGLSDTARLPSSGPATPPPPPAPPPWRRRSPPPWRPRPATSRTSGATCRWSWPRKRSARPGRTSRSTTDDDSSSAGGVGARGNEHRRAGPRERPEKASRLRSLPAFSGRSRGPARQHPNPLTTMQLKKIVEPFGEVNVHPAAGGKQRVVATILMEPNREGTQTGIALDGSGSMQPLYGMPESGGFLASLFGGGKKAKNNDITPVAQHVTAYLARKIDADGGTTCIYWATGPGGSQVEEISDLTADQAEKHFFGPPKEYGTGTQLLPAVRYFVDRFRDAPWGFYVFITDGELHDLGAVKTYTTELARSVAAKRRNPLKFVLVGVGPNVNERQMEELDDLDTGTDIDLWDHKIAGEMRQLTEIFAEVVDKNARIADRARILDPSGKTLKDYSDTGLTGYLEFEVPGGTAYFTLEVNGNRIHQGLSDGASVPASELKK